MDNFTAHAGTPLWVIDWDADDKHRYGSNPELIIGWTIMSGTLYPVSIPTDGLPVVRRNKVSIYDSVEDALRDAESHEEALNAADRAAAAKP